LYIFSDSKIDSYGEAFLTLKWHIGVSYND